ncbi:MAG TPA: fibronectin type III domain-containing protein [Candidatus Edwardsbacteria bacterium]|nr:fibronectin type III domain-containing protein [Candidatus Edwardsbacteria bacterium]
MPATAALLALCANAFAVRPPAQLQAKDSPDDEGGKVRLEWRLSPDDSAAAVKGYLVERAASADGPYAEVRQVFRGSASYEDQKLQDKTDYYYRVRALGAAGDTSEPAQAGPVQARQQWFRKGKLNAVIGLVLFLLIIVYYLRRAQKENLFLRRLAGLDALEESVGRATEMGRPILCVLGSQGLDSVATIAGLNILGQVARQTAEYGTPLLVPTQDFIIQAVAREVVKTGYAAQGHPDRFSEDSVFYVVGNQMGYASAISGLMSRQRPAANLFVGHFYAEAMVMAEAGNATGAIQIAGTDAVTQLPFFIVACDYTLMGEELFAASAYLSRQPQLVGTIKAQDLGKVILVALLLALSVLTLALRTPFFYNLLGVQ